MSENCSDLNTPCSDDGECPLCGGRNDCQMCSGEAHKGLCWCMQARIPDALLTRVPADLRKPGCICQRCVASFWRQNAGGRLEPPQANDFYFDGNGLLVFKAEYHLRRGYCCGSRCRHCPYPATRERP